MMTPTKMNLQIVGFCNCKGCIRKVKTAFSEIGGVKLISMNPDDGEFTILTDKQPEIVQFALQKKLKRNICIQQETGVLSSSLLTPQVNVNDLANALVTMSHAKGLQSVEYKQQNTFKFNFNSPENQPSRSPPTSNNIHKDVPTFPAPPPSTIKPSAPLLPASYDDNPHGCCTIP